MSDSGMRAIGGDRKTQRRQAEVDRRVGSADGVHQVNFVWIGGNHDEPVERIAVLNSSGLNASDIGCPQRLANPVEANRMSRR